MADTHPHRWSEDEDAALRETLRHCSPVTCEEEFAFRQDGDPRRVTLILAGILQRYVDREYEERLAAPIEELRLREDLGLDSLSLMEIAIVLEDVFQVTLGHSEIRTFLTLGEARRALEAKLRGVGDRTAPASASAGAGAGAGSVNAGPRR